MARHNKVGSHKTSVNGNHNSGTVRYHSTTVVNWDNEDIILDNGGWMSATTKLRMNQAANEFDLGYSVHQEDWSWYTNGHKWAGNRIIIDRKTGEIKDA